jgi:hypothetical protein
MTRRNLYLEDFSPQLQIGDAFVMVGAAGLKQAKGGGSGLYIVTAIESTGMSLNPHGVLVVWADSGAAPAGYVADENMQATANHIAAGSNYRYSLNRLIFRAGQLAILRFRVKPLGALTGVIDDYDVLLYSTGATQRWGFNKVSGVLNAMFQGQDPGDSIVAPAQGANIALPATFPNAPPSHWSVRTQMHLLEDASLQVQVNNNGAGATVGGAIGLSISGWVYNFEPVENFGGLGDPGSWPPRRLLPSIDAIPVPDFLTPADITIVQVEQRAPR